MKSITLFTGNENEIKIREVGAKEYQNIKNEHKNSIYGQFQGDGKFYDLKGCCLAQRITVDSEKSAQVEIQYYEVKTPEIFFGVPYRLTEEIN